MSQYFDNDKSVKSEKKLIKFNFNNKLFEMQSDNGVFSKDKFDFGTRILLESINIESLTGRVLDLGCGTGAVSIIIGTFNKNVFIDAVDINERAINLAKENTILNNVNANIFMSNIYDLVSEKYDYIITNPPIRSGKDVVRKFFLGSFDYLK